MTTSLILDLPYPPSVNHYWRRVGNKTLLSAEGRRYRQEVLHALCGICPLVAFAPSARLHVQISLSPPDHRRRDLDNTLKAMLDALQHANVYADDSQIDRIDITRQSVIPGGAVRVRIEARSN